MAAIALFGICSTSLFTRVLMQYNNVRQTPAGLSRCCVSWWAGMGCCLCSSRHEDRTPCHSTPLTKPTDHHSQVKSKQNTTKRHIVIKMTPAKLNQKHINTVRRSKVNSWVKNKMGKVVFSGVWVFLDSWEEDLSDLEPCIIWIWSCESKVSTNTKWT